MGQHKYNPTAIAAANAELPPKPKKLGKRESERLLKQMICAEMYNRTGMAPSPNGGIMVSKSMLSHLNSKENKKGEWYL